jgi:hypothetical protein
MRKLHLLSLPLLAAAAVFTLTRFGGADTPAAADPSPVKLPDAVARGVVAGDHFYAVIGAALIDVDLKKQEAKTLFEDASDTYVPRLAPYVEVAGGKALVAGRKQLQVVDVATGKVARAADFRGDVRGLGFAGDDRAFVMTPKDVVLVDLARGEAVQTVSLLKDDTRMNGLTACQKAGDRLYVVVGQAYSSELAVIDLKEGKLLDRSPANSYWVGGICVTGERAYEAGINFSYGINSKHYWTVDLKNKKTLVELKLDQTDPYGKGRVKDADAATSTHLALVAGPDGTVLLPTAGTLFQYDADGKEVSKTAVPEGVLGRLVGTWNGYALMAGEKNLQFVKLAKPAK